MRSELTQSYRLGGRDVAGQRLEAIPMFDAVFGPCHCANLRKQNSAVARKSGRAGIARGAHRKVHCKTRLHRPS